MSELHPNDGLGYVGCPTCGWTTTVPLEAGEEPPVCLHIGNEKVRWRPPTTMPWTRMVRVKVVA